MWNSHWCAAASALSCVWDTCTVSLFPPPPPLVPNPGCPRTGLVPPGTGHWALVLAWTLQPQDPTSSSLPSSLLFLLPLLLAHVLQPQFDIQLSIQHERLRALTEDNTSTRLRREKKEIFGADRTSCWVSQANVPSDRGILILGEPIRTASPNRQPGIQQVTNHSGSSETSISARPSR